MRPPASAPIQMPSSANHLQILPSSLPAFSDDNEDEEDKKDEDADSITQVPDELLLETAIHSSYLKKRGERRTWKKRFFVLRPTRLAYYKTEHESMPSLRSVRYPNTDGKRPFAFAIVLKERTFYLRAQSEQLMNDWIHRIKDAIKLIPNTYLHSPTRHAASTFPPPTLHLNLKDPGLSLHLHEDGKDPIPSLHINLVKDPVPSLKESVVTSTSFLTTESVVASDLIISKHEVSNDSSARSSKSENLDSLSARSSKSESVNLSDPRHSNVEHTNTSSFRHSKSEHPSDANDPGSPDSDQEHTEPKLTDEQLKDAVIIQGYLFRLKGLPKTWRKNWCVLRSTTLTIYKDEKEYEVMSMLPLSKILSIHSIDPPLKKHDDACFKIVHGKKSWIFKTLTEEEKEEWMAHLSRAYQAVI